MFGTRARWAAWLLVVLGGLGSAAAPAAEPTPDEVLKSRGLKRTGSFYVLDAEADFLAKVGKLQPSYQRLKGLYNKLAAITQDRSEYEQLDDQWTLLNERLRNVQAEIDTHPPLSNNLLKQHWYDLLEAEKQLRFQWNELNREVNLRYRKLVPDREREKVADEFGQRREDFLKETRSLKTLADRIKHEYEGLAGDDAVKQALGALRGSTKARLDLGPSPEFKKKSTWLSGVEKATAPENLTPKTKGQKRTTKAPGTSAAKGKRAGPSVSGETRARPR